MFKCDISALRESTAFRQWKLVGLIGQRFYYPKVKNVNYILERRICTFLPPICQVRLIRTIRHVMSAQAAPNLHWLSVEIHSVINGFTLV